MRENKACHDIQWKDLSTEELEKALQKELEKDLPNEEVVLPILCVLEERDKNIPVSEMPEMLAFTEKYKEYQTPSKRLRYRKAWIAGIAALAAVVCLAVIPQTAGAEGMLDALYRWSGSVFEFLVPEHKTVNPPVEIVFETDNPGLQELYDKISDLGVTKPVVPMWLPEELVLLELQELHMSGGKKVFATFTNGHNFSITYRISTDISAKFEKKDSSVEIYEYDGVSHFILENDKNLSITWTVDGVESLINTNISKEDVYKVINSIYRRNLE